MSIVDPCIDIYIDEVARSGRRDETPSLLRLSGRYSGYSGYSGAYIWAPEPPFKVKWPSVNIKSGQLPTKCFGFGKISFFLVASSINSSWQEHQSFGSGWINIYYQLLRVEKPILTNFSLRVIFLKAQHERWVRGADSQRRLIINYIWHTALGTLLQISFK